MSTYENAGKKNAEGFMSSMKSKFFIFFPNKSGEDKVKPKKAAKAQLWRRVVLLSGPAFKFVYQCRNDLEQIAHYTESRDLEYRSVRILVYRDDRLRRKHPQEIRHCSRNTACYIYFGPDHLAGLADLVAVGYPSRVHGRARSADRASRSSCKFFYQTEFFGSSKVFPFIKMGTPSLPGVSLTSRYLG
jgi:hypothetical protein